MILLLLSLISVAHPTIISQAEAGSPVGEGRQDRMLVGLGEVAFEFPEGTPLGGFGTPARRRTIPNLKRGKNHILFRPNQGTIDPVRAKAMVVKRAQTKSRAAEKLLFLSLDLVGVTTELHSDLVQRLSKRGYTGENIWISATHTHHGPGALSKKKFWGMMAMDFYQKRVYAALIDGILKAVDAAEQTAIASELRYREFETEGLTRHRRKTERGTDPMARAIWVNDLAGKLRGGLILFSVHGIALNDKNLKFSADAPGGIESGLREAANQKAKAEGRYYPESEPVFLFVNGAEGDISPNFRGEEGIREIGRAFAEQAKAHLGEGTTLPAVWKAHLGEAYLGPASLNVVACIRDPKQGRELKGLKLIEWLKIGLKRAFPSQTLLWMLDWGDLRLLSWPGEPTVTLGRVLTQAALRAEPSRKPWIFGLTNGHLAYFVTPKEFKEGGLEPCSSMYGPKGGMIIVEAYEDLFCRAR